MLNTEDMVYLRIYLSMCGIC